jgi:hypothetical protein
MLDAPGQLQSLAGQEHGRTIPLATPRDHQLLHCERIIRGERLVYALHRVSVPFDGIDPVKNGTITQTIKEHSNA